MDISDIASRASTAFALFPQRQQKPVPETGEAQAVFGTNTQNSTNTTATAASSRAIQTQSASVEESSARQEEAEPKGLQDAVKKVQNFVNMATCDIQFSIDEDSGHTVVKVIDRETKDVIRQIPSEEMLDLAQALDKLQGLLIKQKA